MCTTATAAYFDPCADKYKRYEVDWKPNYDNGKGYSDKEAYVSQRPSACRLWGGVGRVSRCSVP